MPSLGLNPLLKTSFSFLSHNCSPQDQIKGGIETKQDPVGPFQEQKSFCKTTDLSDPLSLPCMWVQYKPSVNHQFRWGQCALRGNFVYTVERLDMLTGNLYFVLQINYLKKGDVEPRWWLWVKIGDDIKRVRERGVMNSADVMNFNRHRWKMVRTTTKQCDLE